MDYAKKQAKRIEILKQLYDTGKIDEKSLGLDYPIFTQLLEEIQEDGHISGAKFAKSKTSLTVWHDNVRLSDKGAQLVNPTEEKEITSTTFNFHGGDFRGAGFGSNITINNKWDESLDELKNYINDLDQEEKIIGNEMVKIIESKDIKPGIFSRFAGFLEKHPNVVSLAGKAIVWALSMS